jgi:hypothetical protein
MIPNLIVRIYRRDLVAARACADGIAIYDAIAAMALARGDERATKRLRIRWTPLHSLWLAKAYPSHSNWLIEQNIVPSLPNLRGADLYGADLRGADLYGANLGGADLGDCYWPKSRPAPEGWTHDPPVADREWIALRRAESTKAVA